MVTTINRFLTSPLTAHNFFSRIHLIPFRKTKPKHKNGLYAHLRDVARRFEEFVTIGELNFFYLAK